MVIPIILAGGTGSQLWPLSREIQPKQFQVFQGQHTLFQEAACRLKPTEEIEGFDGFGAPIVLCTEAHRFIVAEQLRTVGVVPADIVLEPESRGSAPAAAAGVLTALLSNRHPHPPNYDPLVLVTSSDVVISHLGGFLASMRRGAARATSGHLMVFGVQPDRALADLGYLRPGGPVRDGDEGICTRTLVEFMRPTGVGAAADLCAAGWLWNSGMFLARASVLLSRLGVAWDKGPIAEATRKATRSTDFCRLAARPWSDVGRESLDAVIFSDGDGIAIEQLEAGWGEIGSWASAHAAGPSDLEGNQSYGDVALFDVRGSYVRSSHRLVVAVGVSDLAVVETADAVLVAPLGRTQGLREVVDSLIRNGREEAIAHRKVLRPWGSYEGIDRSARYQVKRITVLPGASLSLQLHHRRSEHWVVVTGQAWVTRGEEQFALHPNQSTYIPIGMQHRLENRWEENLEMIEVQCGDYLGEDDIVRLEDLYDRAPVPEKLT